MGGGGQEVKAGECIGGKTLVYGQGEGSRKSEGRWGVKGEKLKGEKLRGLEKEL